MGAIEISDTKKGNGIETGWMRCQKIEMDGDEAELVEAVAGKKQDSLALIAVVCSTVAPVIKNDSRCG